MDRGERKGQKASEEKEKEGMSEGGKSGVGKNAGGKEVCSPKDDKKTEPKLPAGTPWVRFEDIKLPEPKLPAGAPCVRFEDIKLDPGKYYGLDPESESSYKVYDGPPGGAKTRQTARMVSCPCPCRNPDGGICPLHLI